MAPTVLIADDHPDTAESFAALFRTNGCEAFVAATGGQALDIAALLQPKVLVLDVTMPELSGPEVCRRIRTELWGRDALIITISGRTDELSRRSALDSGSDHHLVKPVDFDALWRFLESHPKFSLLSIVQISSSPVEPV